MENKPGNNDSFLTLRESAKYLGISPRTVRRLIDRNELVVHYFGSCIRIRVGDLEDYILVNRFGRPRIELYYPEAEGEHYTYEDKSQ